MDDGRVPIDLTEEHAPVEVDAKSYTREDGTLVIDILVEPPCGVPVEGEIIVCASGESPNQYDPPEPAAEEGFKPEIQIGENTKMRARAETDSRTGADRVMIDLVYKF